VASHTNPPATCHCPTMRPNHILCRDSTLTWSGEISSPTSCLPRSFISKGPFFTLQSTPKTHGRIDRSRTRPVQYGCTVRSMAFPRMRIQMPVEVYYLLCSILSFNLL
ncbi:hypothetical protein T265_07138, partial [Opisthorchis viverrini]